MKSVNNIFLILCLASLGAYAQAQDLAEQQRYMAELQQSHIEANVPSSEVFKEYLVRDLNEHFSRDGRPIEVRYELLRNAPTQSGLTYPKYYLWVEIFSGEEALDQGAVRVAAIEKERFEITNILRKSEILSTPESAAKVFPRLLLERINELAHGK